LVAHISAPIRTIRPQGSSLSLTSRSRAGRFRPEKEAAAGHDLLAGLEALDDFYVVAEGSPESHGAFDELRLGLGGWHVDNRAVADGLHRAARNDRALAGAFRPEGHRHVHAQAQLTRPIRNLDPDLRGPRLGINPRV